MGTRPLTLRDILQIIRRRKWWLVIPFSMCFLGLTIVALILPPVYESTSTILIEQQNVASDYVKTKDTTYAEQFLQMINQRIMTSAKLLKIINTFQLYPSLQKNNNTEALIKKMRDDITLQPISADIGDTHGGKTNQSATIAFNLSYDGKADPKKVQAVAEELASLFLQENIQVRQRQATELTGFFDEEAKKLKEQIDISESRIANFKQGHVNDLPELLQVNVVGMHDVQRSIDDTNNKLKDLKVREGYLKTQLMGTPSQFKETERQHLSELQVQFADMRDHLSDEHPDMIKTKAEIAMLERRLKLAGSNGADNTRPDNPAYIALASQLSSVQSEIGSVTAQLHDLNERLMSFKRSISKSPQVESEYQKMIIERDNMKAKYDDLMKKYMDSRMSKGLSEMQNWERFTLIDPARVPDKPIKPNRLGIILVGLVMGLGSGIGAASVREYTDNTVRNASYLSRLTAIPVLASIPDIITEYDHSRTRTIVWACIFALVAVVIIGLGIVFVPALT